MTTALILELKENFRYHTSFRRGLAHLPIIMEDTGCSCTSLLVVEGISLISKLALVLHINFILVHDWTAAAHVHAVAEVSCKTSSLSLSPSSERNWWVNRLHFWNDTSRCRKRVLIIAPILSSLLLLWLPPLLLISKLSKLKLFFFIWLLFHVNYTCDHMLVCRRPLVSAESLVCSLIVKEILSLHYHQKGQRHQEETSKHHWWDQYDLI